MKVVGKKGLVSIVESYVEDMDHRHMVVVLESHKVVHIGESLEVVYMEFVVLGSIGVGMVVALDMVHMVVGIVGMG